jgi:hypothetical protein
MIQYQVFQQGVPPANQLEFHAMDIMTQGARAQHRTRTGMARYRYIAALLFRPVV